MSVEDDGDVLDSQCLEADSYLLVQLQGKEMGKNKHKALGAIRDNIKTIRCSYPLVQMSSFSNSVG
jgi:hypothetical protein